MVEGARLESVYTRKGIEGSNPSVSADGDKQGKSSFVPFLFSPQYFAASAIKTESKLAFPVRMTHFSGNR